MTLNLKRAQSALKIYGEFLAIYLPKTPFSFRRLLIDSAKNGKIKKIYGISRFESS